MARNEITFLVNLRKNTNTTSNTYGKYYDEAESTHRNLRHQPGRAGPRAVTASR